MFKFSFSPNTLPAILGTGGFALILLGLLKMIDSFDGIFIGIILIIAGIGLSIYWRDRFS